ncbi:MAG: formate dehydrogenase subunit alpha [Methyloligellaceae bacterium]
MVAKSDVLTEQIEFSIDGMVITAFEHETILQAAKRSDIEIPHLCFKEGLRPDGNCRACVVEIEGERVLAPSCCRYPTTGMKVHSSGGRARKSQKLVLELLQSDVVETEYTLESELDFWVKRLEVDTPRFISRKQPSSDGSHPAIAVNLDACIQCTRCLRACREAQVNDVIGFAGRGQKSKIIFDLDDSLGASSCVACGECVQACPTGALMPANSSGFVQADKKVDSVCPYCGVGCLLTYHVKDNKIIRVEGRDGPANEGRLCVKGRYGFDYVSHRQRLLKPLIRKNNIPKGLNEYYDPANPLKMFREASWEEALDFAAQGFNTTKSTYGGNAMAGFGSAKGSNEEAYLFQKMIRTGFGTNNVDHCTRLCHASSVVALLEGIGSGAVSNQVSDVSEAEVIIVIGSNPTSNHPVAATFMKNAVKDGKKLIVMDPRRTDIARHATYFLQFNPDSDVAMLNALIYTIVEEDLVDRNFIQTRTENYELLKSNVEAFSPEAMQTVCGIDAETLREVARTYATAKSAMIFWGMGVSQHIHGTDNARCLIALSMITGQIGKPGTGLHPLRGQNNVQGASDAGLIPMFFPDYQAVDNPDVNKRFTEFWNAELDDKRGLTVVEIMHAITDGKLHGMYIMGENPAMSDPNLNHARKALEQLEHLVVQDLFLTETAAFADVILPASGWAEKDGTVTNTDRRVQLGRQALELPGDVKQDLWIIQQLANRIGLDWHYKDASEVYEEMRQCMGSISGISWKRLLDNESVTYPCADADDPGQSWVFGDKFPTKSGKARLVPTQIISADEVPDESYPFILMTGRQLEHWHTGTMTRRSEVLDAIEPIPVVYVNPQDLDAISGESAIEITVRSRRGELTANARSDPGLSRGQVFIPFCYQEAAANLLTNEALDPFGKIPEFKYCAVAIESSAQRNTD